MVSEFSGLDFDIFSTERNLPFNGVVVHHNQTLKHLIYLNTRSANSFVSLFFMYSR